MNMTHGTSAWIGRAVAAVGTTALLFAACGGPETGTKIAGQPGDSGTYVVRFEGRDWMKFSVPRLSGAAPAVTLESAEDGWTRVHMAWDVPKETRQDELSVRFDVLLTPDLWWAPHLSPNEGDIIAQHVFRSPALIAVERRDILAIIPDLNLVGRDKAAPWFLDLDAPRKSMRLGLARSRVYTHVGYKQEPGMTFPPGRVELAFFVKARRDPEDPANPRPVNPWSEVTRFLWRRYGHPLFARGEPNRVPMDRYVEHTYNWAFQTWKDAVWQEFDLGGKRVGAPAFIVNQTQSPNYRGEQNLREFLSIWNQAWFSSLRSATGVLRYARRAGRPDLEAKAGLTREFALASPMTDGIFPSVYGTDMTKVKIGGKEYKRSKGWGTGHWMNSDRCPAERGITPEWYHVLDASWTALLMLRWHEEMEKDPRLLEYATRYGEKLVRLQDGRGFFPAWLDPKTQAPSPVLADSPETSQSVTFLLALGRLTGRKEFREAAVKAMDAVIRDVIPAGRWEDFETYWSCCDFWIDRIGQKIPRNGMYKQNTFSMFWTAEALLETYRETGDRKYLAWGRRALDELSMFQQVWQPPFIYVPALGGFGVMNYDGEWNDSRESLFAELFMRYYRETDDPDLFERGVAALKSAFIMMYCPENPKAKVQWEKVHTFFGPADYGFTMENYGHGGETSAEGMGIGVFTIYDWGNGAAAEGWNRVYDHFGSVYIDRGRGLGFGVDSVAVKPAPGGTGGYELTDMSDSSSPRTVKVVFEDGSSRTVTLSGPTVVH
jgi:hypothetical protein